MNGPLCIHEVTIVFFLPLQNRLPSDFDNANRQERHGRKLFQVAKCRRNTLGDRFFIFRIFRMFDSDGLN